MAEMERTCANCVHATPDFTLRSKLVYYCNRTNAVIPGKYEVDAEGKEAKATFWRIPIDCPRMEGVEKSATSVPDKYQEIKTFTL